MLARIYWFLYGLTAARWHDYQCRRYVVADHGEALFARTINDGQGLTVNASTALWPDDPSFAEVDDYCRSTCWSEQWSSLLDDDTMMSGKSRYTVLALHQDCPGTNCSHRRDSWSLAYAT